MANPKPHTPTTLFQQYDPMPCSLCGVVHTAPVVTVVGYISVFSLCPAYDHTEDPPQPETIPFAYPVRSWSAGGGSSSAVAPPFFGSTDAAADEVIRQHYYRRNAQTRLASMSSMTGFDLLFGSSSSAVG